MSIETAKDVDLVYAGRRLLVGGKPGDVYYVLNQDKSLGEKLIYPAARGASRSIGCVYTGAKLEDGEKRTVYGLRDVRWKSNYAKVDEVAVAGWEALHSEFRASQETKRAEAKHREVVVEMVLPIRKMMGAMHKRGAHEEATALRNMVMNELFRPLTKAEKESDE